SSPTSIAGLATRTTARRRWTCSRSSIANRPSSTRSAAPHGRKSCHRGRIVTSGRRRSCSHHHSRREFLRLLGAGAASLPALSPLALLQVNRPRSLASHARPASAPAFASAPAPVVFTDITTAAGLSHAINVSGPRENKQFL